MPKRTRKPSPRQLDPSVKRDASWLKAHGLLSKRAKLNRKAVSKGVAKKVETLRDQGIIPAVIAGQRLPQAYVGYKAKPALVREAKEKHYAVANGRIIIPNDPSYRRRFQEQMKRGLLSGVTPLAQGGMIESITLSDFSISSWRDLFIALRNGSFEGLKAPDEKFAFKLAGGQSRQFFNTAAEMRSYLEMYRFMNIADWDDNIPPEDMADDVFELFEAVRFRPPVQWPSETAEEYAARRKRGARTQQNRRGGASRAKTIKLLAEQREARERDLTAARMTKYREGLGEDRKAADREAAKQRMKSLRDERKAERFGRGEYKRGPYKPRK